LLLRLIFFNPSPGPATAIIGCIEAGAEYSGKLDRDAVLEHGRTALSVSGQVFE